MFSSVKSFFLHKEDRGNVRYTNIKGHTNIRNIYLITEHGNGGVTLLKSVQEAQQVYNRDSFTQLIPNFYSQK